EIGCLVGVGTKGAGHRHAGDAFDGGGGREQIPSEFAVVVGGAERIEDQRMRRLCEEGTADAAVVQAAGGGHEGAEQWRFGGGVDERGWGFRHPPSRRGRSSSGSSSWPQRRQRTRQPPASRAWYSRVFLGCGQGRPAPAERASPMLRRRPISTSLRGDRAE